MEVSDIRPGDVLRNVSSGFVGKVASVQGVRIFLINSDGGESLFHFGPFWEKLDHKQSEEFTAQIKVPTKAALLAVRRGRSSDPAEIERQFEIYMLQLRKANAYVETGFRTFWAEVLKIIGNKPGITWEMRNSAAFGLNVVIRIASKRPRSTNWVHFMHLFGDGGPDHRSLDLIALDEHVPEKYEPLFPLRQSFYGTGSGAELNM